MLNRVASPRHEALVRDGMAQAGVRVLGALPRKASIELPERHLGLVQAGETPELARILAEAGSFIAAHCDLDAIRAAAAPTRSIGGTTRRSTPPGQRIALAQDAAFSFTYPHLLNDWRAQGQRSCRFRRWRIKAPTPAPIAAGCRGYPELHAGALGQAEGFRSRIRAFAETRPVHGECGGYMAMGAALIDAKGVSHPMAGLLGLVTSYEKRRMHLGYRLAQLAAPIPGHGAGRVCAATNSTTRPFWRNRICRSPRSWTRPAPRAGNRITAWQCQRHLLPSDR
ncbi:hypothetical protein ACFSHQ_00945 [Gemmobacter lanyuensis]